MRFARLSRSLPHQAPLLDRMAQTRVLSFGVVGGQTATRRHFAPLDPALKAADDGLILKAVVFDVDGTMCLPQNYMFGEMRSVLGIDKSVDILNHIYSLEEPAQTEAMNKVKAIERAAMSRQTPQPGLRALMAHLDSRQIPKAICTRNFNGPVEHLLSNFLPKSKFWPIITRDFKPPKPDPAGILHIAKELGVEAEMPTADNPAQRRLPMIMVGDSVDDMLAGRRAGAATVLLVNKDNVNLATHESTDFVVSSLTELISVLDAGFVSREI